jgi:phospholipase/carboxylesterase
LFAPWACDYREVTESGLVFRVRPSGGDPAGAVVLFHGRGADEHDLFPLLDALDPDRRLIGVAPRGPLELPPGGAHWYAVHRVGFPDPQTFDATYRVATEWLDGWLTDNEFEHDRVVLGGFSQGAVMAYALGLGTGRPRPAGIVALSGFIPTVESWELDRGNVAGLPVAIGHGTFDPVIAVDFGRTARDRLQQLDADVTFAEAPMPHTIDPAFVEVLRAWMRARFQ